MTTRLELAIVDYGMGNRRSVEKALEHVGVNATITSDPAGPSGRPAGSFCPASAPSPERCRTSTSSGWTS